MQYLKSQEKEEAYIFSKKGNKYELIGKMHTKKGIEATEKIASQLNFGELELVEKIEILNLIAKEKEKESNLSEEIREQIKKEVLEELPKIPNEEKIKLYLKVGDVDLRFFFYKKIKDVVKFE